MFASDGASHTWRGWAWFFYGCARVPLHQDPNNRLTWFSQPSTITSLETVLKEVVVPCTLLVRMREWLSPHSMPMFTFGQSSPDRRVDLHTNTKEIV
ncbi:unnamed protein product [Choristocarpus tenellus]